MSTSPRKGFCIYTDTFFQGPILTVRDGDERPYIFDTEVEAQQEIVDHAMTRLQQFLDSERDFKDSLTVDEYVVPVTVQLDGSVIEGHWRMLGKES